MSTITGSRSAGLKLRRRFTKLLVAATVVGSLTTGIASPAAAAPNIWGQPIVFPQPENHVRGGLPWALLIAVPTTEGAAFTVTWSEPAGTVVSMEMCRAGSLPCTFTPLGSGSASVTVGQNGTGSPEERVWAEVLGGLSAKRDVDLISTEGAGPMERRVTVSAQITPMTGTSGMTWSVASPLIRLTADSVDTPTEAEIQLTTTAPTGNPPVQRGSIVTYTASLTRVGLLTQTTDVEVRLVPDAAGNTTVISRSGGGDCAPVDNACQLVTFLSGETAKTVSFWVDVPFVPAGTATYHFVAKYDPTGSDGVPVDTETGNAASIQIVNPPRSVGAPSLFLDDFYERTGSGSLAVSVPATEAAEFDLAVSAPGLIATLPRACATSSEATCTIVDGDVTIDNDGDAIDVEPLTVTFTVGLAATAVDLFSNEAASPPSGTARVSATVTAEGGSTGGIQTATGAATVRADTVTTPTEAEIRLSTTAPTGTPTVNRGNTLTYTAELTRLGDLTQATKVAVDLAADNAQGTSVISGHGGAACAAPNSSCRSITFMPGEGATARTVSFIVDVPAGASLGTATYRFVATYDPTGTSGGPTDTEIGNPMAFQVAAATPRATTAPPVTTAPATAPPVTTTPTTAAPVTTTPTTAAPVTTTPTTAAPVTTTPTTAAPVTTTPTTAPPEIITSRAERGDPSITVDRQPSVDLDRLESGDRIATAVTVSQHAFPRPQSAGAVVLARSDDFADALAGTPLAVERNAPLLLTESADLNASVATELRRVLRPGGTVVLLGGTKALSETTENAVRALGSNTQRFSGPDRYATAVAIAREGLANPRTLLLTTGLDFPDAIVAGTAAAAKDGAVLLTAGATLPEATRAYIADREGATRYAVGGPAAQADPPATPLLGEDRYATAVAVADEFFDDPASAGVASGEDFPDALLGGVLMGRLGGPMLVTSPSGLNEATHLWLRGHADELANVYLFGGPLGLSDPVEDEIRKAVRR